MRNLISSNLMRLRKYPMFWLAVVAAAVNPLYVVLNNYYYGKQWNYSFPPDTALITVAVGYIFPITLAILIALFIGTEYSDKTIRNKLIVGHTRLSLYLSNLITCVVSALTMYAAGVLAAIAAGVPLLGSYEATAKVLLPQIGCTLLSVTALASIFTLFSVLISNRVIGGIVTLLVAFGLAFLPQTLWLRLCHPIEEFNASGVLRMIYQFLYDALPTCQLYQYKPEASHMPNNLNLFPLYSVLIISVTSFAGILGLKKKDIK